MEMIQVVPVSYTHLEEAYGFDEFGNDIRTAKDIFQDSMQSFGFTGYQMDLSLIHILMEKWMKQLIMWM